METNEIVINLVPKHPDFPEFPSLTWFNENGHQCISNEDALKVLDYWENTIPQYLFEVEKYEKSIATILGAL